MARHRTGTTTGEQSPEGSGSAAPPFVVTVTIVDDVITTEAATETAYGPREAPPEGAPPAIRALATIRQLALDLRHRSDMPALSLGCLELAVEAAEQALLILAAVDPRVKDNDQVARAVGAALLVLRDARSVGTRRVAVDEGLLRGHVMLVLNRHAALLPELERRTDIVRRTVDAIASLTGASLDDAIVREALASWASPRSWLPNGPFVMSTRNLLRPLGLDANADALRKTWERYVAEPEGS